MPFTPDIAAKRFGYGLSPRVPAPQSVEAMLAGLQQPDAMAAVFGIRSYHDLQQQQVKYSRFRQHAREAVGTPEGDASDEKWQALRAQGRQNYARAYVQIQLRRINTPDGFRERLVAFWADHFTVYTGAGMMREATPQYIEEVIRPGITSKFPDLLQAAVLHPLMVHYLDQHTSVGPNSKWALRRRDGRGVNENLAREVLELHSMGVDGPYAQRDVRALAHLLTGVGRTRDFSLRYTSRTAEPGGQNVLGQTYPAKLSMARVKSVLNDLATHPATAAHIARKLAVHFIADEPPRAVVDAMQSAFVASDGDLMQVYAAMLNHPDTWAQPAQNMQTPDAFVSSALRGLGVSDDQMTGLSEKQVKSLFWRPLTKMGQTWLRPNGPDGWDEDDAGWITPQGIAGRMEWAMRVPERVLKTLPEPDQMLRDVLGTDVPPKVAFAAQAAERRADAIGLILMSPAFQRR